jgi:hypothetical protein
MIKKIEEQGDLEKINEGTILIKYPISGEFTATVDFHDHGNLLQYEVHSFNKDMQLIQLKIPTGDMAENPAASLPLDIDKTNYPIINKPFDDLITDKIWWYDVE